MAEERFITLSPLKNGIGFGLKILLMAILLCFYSV
jgi:hypothetical protein